MSLWIPKDENTLVPSPPLDYLLDDDGVDGLTGDSGELLYGDA